MTGLYLTPTRVYAAEVDALARLLGGRVGLDVLADLNRMGRPARPPGRAVAEAWTFDLLDRLTLRWWPQGVAIRDGVAAVTWYDKPAPRSSVRQGSRVTFFDLTSHRYRNVLLVRPTLEDGVAGLKPLRIHAGGLAWHEGRLYVAATNGGLYVCDLADVLRVPDRGVVASSGYRYVLPIRQRLKTEADDGTTPLRWSFLSIDDAGLLAGGEHTNGDRSRRLATFPLGQGRVEATTVSEGVNTMQGVVLVDGVQHVTTSRGRLRRGSVWTGPPDHLVQHRAATPMGCEDLAHTPATDDLWTVTEHPLARWITRMPLSTFA